MEHRQVLPQGASGYDAIERGPDGQALSTRRPIWVDRIVVCGIHAEVSIRYNPIPTHFAQVAFPYPGMYIAVNSGEGGAAEKLSQCDIDYLGVCLEPECLARPVEKLFVKHKIRAPHVLAITPCHHSSSPIVRVKLENPTHGGDGRHQPGGNVVRALQCGSRGDAAEKRSTGGARSVSGGMAGFYPHPGFRCAREPGRWLCVGTWPAGI